MQMMRWMLLLLAGLVALIVFSALWAQQRERSGIRFAVRLNKGRNEIRLGLSPGYYWFRFDREGNVGIAGTSFEHLEGVTLRTVVSCGTDAPLLSISRALGSFRMVRRAANPVVVTVDSQSDGEKPVYFCFSRGK